MAWRLKTPAIPSSGRWYRSLKNQVLLKSYYLPGDLKTRIAESVNQYNPERHQESLDKLTPENVLQRHAI